MATRTVTNTDYVSAITVPGDVTVDTVNAETGTFSDSVTAPTGTFTHLRANTASFDEIKDHIRTVDSIIELDTGNEEDKRTSGIITKYISENVATLGEVKYAGILRGGNGSFHLVDDTTLPDPDTNPATLAKADLTVKQLSTAGVIMPVTNAAYDIGSGSLRYRNLYLGRGTGNVHLGVNTTIGNAAQMFLHSAGDGYSQIHFGRDAVGASNTKWLLSSRLAADDNAFELFRGPYLTGSSTHQKIWSVSGSNGRISYVIDTDATDSTTAPVTYAGGVGIAKSLHVGTSVTAGGNILPSATGTTDLGSSSARFRDLYLGRSNGVINLGINTSGDAGFTMTASGDKYATMIFGRSDAGTKWALSSRVSTQLNNLKFIRGAALTGGAEESIIDIIGTGSDAGQTLFSKETDSASTTTGAVVVKGGVGIAKNLHVGGTITTGGHILPSTDLSYDLGSASTGFRELRLARGTGKIALGWSVRVSSQAELHLNSSSGARSEITFGTGELQRSNVKWAFNSYRSNEGNHFTLMRGPAMTTPASEGQDPPFEPVFIADGSNSQFRFVRDTESTSTTTGAMTVAGGVGIAKNLHVGGSVTSGSHTTGTLTVDELKYSENAALGDGFLVKTGQTIQTTAAPTFDDVTVDELKFTSLRHSAGGVTNGVMRIDGQGALQFIAANNASTPGAYTVRRDGTHALSGKFEIGTETTGRVIMGSEAAAAIPDTAHDIIAIGKDAYKTNNRTGSHRVIAIGTEALSLQNVLPSDIQGHIAIGYQAMRSWAGFNTAPINASVAIGYRAMYSSTHGHGNVAIGPEVMYESADGSESVVVGAQAAKKAKPRRSVLIGNNVSGEAIIAQYMDDNVIIGSRSCRYGPSGPGCQRNVIIGSDTTPSITTGNNNTIIGYGAGTTVNASTQCTLYGGSTNVSAAAVNRGAFGYNITNPSDNTTIIGNGSTASVHFGHGSALTASGSATLGTAAAPVKGIYLASPDGAPTLLDRYERFNVITTITGPWTGEKPFFIRITAIGSQVFISAEKGLYSTTQNASLIATPGGSIPERFRPAMDDEVNHVITGVSNAGVSSLGRVTITPSGILTISPDAAGSGGWNHVGGGTVSWSRINVSYSLT